MVTTVHTPSYVCKVTHESSRTSSKYQDDLNSKLDPVLRRPASASSTGMQSHINITSAKRPLTQVGSMEPNKKRMVSLPAHMRQSLRTGSLAPSSRYTPTRSSASPSPSISTSISSRTTPRAITPRLGLEAKLSRHQRAPGQIQHQEEGGDGNNGPDELRKRRSGPKRKAEWKADEGIARILPRAQEYFWFTVVTQNAFGTETEFYDQALEATKSACADFPDEPEVDIPDEFLKTLAATVSSFRGRFKELAQKCVPFYYQFADSEDDNRVKDIVTCAITRGNFCFKNFNFEEYHNNPEMPRTGLCLHPCITAVMQAYFKHQNANGASFIENFRPFPIPAIALCLTAIEYALTEYAEKGRQQKLLFTASVYRSVYTQHMEFIHEWISRAPPARWEEISGALSDVVESFCDPAHHVPKVTAQSERVKVFDTDF